MAWLNLSMPDLDWRQPWTWPLAFQRALWVCAVALGVLLMSPLWLHSVQGWVDATEVQAKLVDQQRITQALGEQVAQLQQSQAQPEVALMDAASLTALAHQQGLQFSQLGLDKPVQTPVMNAMRLQQVPVHLQVQGSWAAWMNWLAQWPASAPGLTLSALELKADPRGGISAQLVAVAPQSSVHESLFELASVDLDGAASADPFNARAWVQNQRSHAQQHPSYGALVVPELMRLREPLESFPRERLQYVGQIASGAELQALIKVLPETGAKKEPSMMSVHRVRVGGHLGQDFGRLLAITSEYLDVQELALAPTGEWQARDVRLPLQETSP